jgi:hypothetical protein
LGTQERLVQGRAGGDAGNEPEGCRLGGGSLAGGSQPGIWVGGQHGVMVTRAGRRVRREGHSRAIEIQAQ